MNVLVFGKDGQLGKAFESLLDSLLLAKDTVIRYVGYANCDLSDKFSLKNLLEQFAPDLIINAAAYTAVDKAETEVALAYAVISCTDLNGCELATASIKGTWWVCVMKLKSFTES